MPTTESTTTDRFTQQEAHKRSLFISREEVARSLGIGRTTVWKLTKAAERPRQLPPARPLRRPLHSLEPRPD